MSRAHVREVDGDVPEDLPELPLSAAPNYVTARGLALLRQRLEDSTARLAALPADERQGRALIERERRWLNARIASAQLVSGARADATRIAFGAVVDVIDEHGQRLRWRIVGEDEADPDAGRISWTSPLARALLGASPGEVVCWPRPSGETELEVRAVDFSPEPAD